MECRYTMRLASIRCGSCRYQNLLWQGSYWWQCPRTGWWTQVGGCNCFEFDIFGYPLRDHQTLFLERGKYDTLYLLDYIRGGSSIKASPYRRGANEVVYSQIPNLNEALGEISDEEINISLSNVVSMQAVRIFWDIWRGRY